MADLQGMVRIAQPGDVVLIENGTYRDVELELDANGTSEDPITIRSASPGGVVFSGNIQIRFSGDFIHLSDLVFRECLMDGHPLVDYDQSENCHVSNMVFLHCSGNRPVVQFRSGSKNNMLRDCKFIDIASRSVHVQVNDTISERGIPEYNVIRNNLFMDIPPLGENGRETVKIGQNQPEFGHIKTHTLVEGNVFIRCDGEAEIISNKAASNTFRGNTFIDCDGELVMRGGHDCLIEKNQFVGCTGGIRLSGTGHTVRNNTIVSSERTGIRLLYGMTRTQGGHYQAVSNCVIIQNTIIDPGQMGILIGEGRNRDWKEKGIQKFAPQKNRITNNLVISDDESFILSNHAPDNLVERNSLHPR
jgi:parallel beta-helix repeat protein